MVYYEIINRTLRPVQKTQLTLERERFAQVMASRTSSRDLIGLAEKLLASDKFSPLYKPYCFADYIAACTERVANNSLDELLVAVKGAWVGDIIRSAYQDEVDQVVCGLVRRALEFVTKADVFERRLQLLVFAGFVRSAEHAIELALDAGMPSEGELRLRDVHARLAARPVDEFCPF